MRQQGLSWADEVGGVVRGSGDHAKAVVSVVSEKAKKYGKTDPADDVEDGLVSAFLAGVREGESKAAEKLESVIRERVRRAVESIVLEPAKCPHCEGPGCDACGDSGRRNWRAQVGF